MTTRIAIAGAGLIGRDHLAALAATPGCELAAIVDPNPAAADIARAAGAPWYPRLPDLLEADRPDGVVLATPNPHHQPGALECMAAGVPVLVEKPLADSAQAARALHAEAERRGARVLVGHHRTHSAIMRRAADIIASGALGEVVAVTGTALFAKPDAYYESAPWRTQPGGGPILLNLIHEIHNLRIMCGEIERVQAVTSNATRGFAVEDTAAIVVGFASGALGTFLLSDAVGSARSWEQTSQENPDYTTYPDEDCYHVAGTMGSLSVPTMRLKRFRSPADRSWYLPLEESVTRPERADPLRAQMAHFAAVIRGEAQPLCTTRDGALNVLVVDAIKRSAASGGVVEIEPL